MAKFALPSSAAAQLRALVSVASADRARPLLNGILFRWRDGQLVAQASDSYCLIEAHLSAASRGEAAAVGAEKRDRWLVDRSDVADWARLLSVTDRSGNVGPVELLLDYPMCSLSAYGRKIDVPGMVRAEDFPDLDRLLDGWERGKVDRISFNQRLLARFARLAPREPLTLQMGARPIDPVKVEIGSYRGLIMPVRLD